MRFELFALRFAGKLRAVDRDRAERRRGPFGPHGIERVAVDRDQFGLGLGAGGRQPFGCRRSVQPRIESEAIAGGKMRGQPAFGGGIDQRLDLPRPGVDLLGGLQRVAAVDEQGGLLRQHDRKAGRAGKAGQPGQPLFRRRDIFILLLIGARNDKSGQFPPRQFLAKRRQPRRQRHAAFGLFECLEMGFEHRMTRLDWRSDANDADKSTMRQRLPQFGTDCASIFASALDRGKRFALQVVLCTIPEDDRECFNSTTRGCTMPAFSFEKISPPAAACAGCRDVRGQETTRRHRPDAGSFCRGARQARVARKEARRRTEARLNPRALLSSTALCPLLILRCAATGCSSRRS